MSFDAQGQWVNDAQGGAVDRGVGGYDGPPINDDDFWTQFDAGRFNNQGFSTPAVAPFGGGAMTNAPQGGGSIADRFRQFGQQNGGDPSAVNDPNYWAGIYNEKVSKGADPTETFNYLTGRITNGSGGGGGFSGGMGNYAPLAPFQYGGSFSTFGAPSVNAPAAFSYQGPGVQAPQDFNFPGVYAPPKPQAAAAPGASSAPAENPYGKEENGMVRLSNGALVPKDHPLAQEYNSWTPPASPPATAGGDQKVQSGLSGPDRAQGNVWTAADAARSGGIVPGGAGGPMSPGGGGTFNENTGQYEGGTPTGPGGVAQFRPPQGSALPGPFSAPTLGNGTPYQPAQSFSYQPLGDLGRMSQTGQINPGENFTYQPLGDATAYTPGQFQATTAADLANDPGYQFRQDQQRKALEQSAAGRGTLNSTGTLKSLADYSGQLASQEFANVDARRRGDFGLNQSLLSDAYKTNEANRQQVQGTQYGQAFDASQANRQASMAAQQGTFSNALAGQGFNNDTALAEQGARYQQGLGAASFDEANRLNAAQFNDQSQIARQGQQYGQAANTYGMNFTNQFNQNQAAQDNARQNFGVQQGAQNQAFTQAIGQQQFNTGNQAEAQNRAFTQQYQPWAQNAGNQLAAGQTSAQLAGQTNALNASQEQQRYLSDWNAYQSQVSQNQFGAGLGLQYGQLGLQANNQNFNQGLATYNTNYQTQVADPWNRNFSVAQLGAQSAGGLGNAGQNYANQAGDLYTGQGNANAAAGIVSGNAWQSALGALGQVPMYASAYNPQTRYSLPGAMNLPQPQR